MDWPSGVAMRLVLLCLDEDGRLRRDGYIEASLRAALLVDLLLDRRITGDVNYWIDDTPTGFAPADALLAAIAADPNEDVAHWLARGPMVERALADEWVAIGAWRHLHTPVVKRRRYRINGGQDRNDRSALIRRIEANKASDQLSEGDAALIVLAATSEVEWLREEVFTPLILHRCGRARGLVEGAAAFITDARRRYIAAITAVSSSGGS